MTRSSTTREALRMYKTSVLLFSLLMFIVTDNTQFLTLFLFALTQKITGAILKLIAHGLLVNFPSIWKRPKGAVNCSGYYNTSTKVVSYGMPSGHAMGSFSLATLGALYILHREQPRKQDDLKKKLTSYSKIAILYALSTLVALSRTEVLGSFSAGGFDDAPRACHTPLQLIVGGTCGIAFSLIFVKYFGKYLFRNQKKKVRFLI